MSDGSDLDQSAAVHDPDPIHELGHQAHVVPHQQDRRGELLLDTRQRLHDLPLHDHVEGAGGSSATINCGASEIAMAMHTRCFMPPLSSCGYMPSTLGCSPTIANNPGSRSATAARLTCVVEADSVENLVADAHDRVE